MRLHSNITLCILWLIIKVCKGVTTVNLHFASNNCDEVDRKSTEKKSYNLTWNGQITPKLCSFSFTGGETYITDMYEICFQSIVYSIPQSMGNVQVKITNYTRTAWDYNHHDTMIPHTCAKNAYKMVVSILVPTGYTEPSPKLYLQLNITANIVGETVPEISNKILVVVIGGFVLLTIFCFGNMIKTDDRCCKMVCEVLGKSCTLLSGCIICQCLREDICRPCGQCCSAWAGWCTTLVLREQGDHANNNSTTVETEMDGMLEDSGHTVNTTLTSDVVQPPPSYNSIRDFSNISDPTLPPPSYAEVTGKTVPTAPPLSEYY